MKKKKTEADSKETKKRTLPKEMKPWQWPKGVSGNPGGKPKKFTTLLSDAIRDELGEISSEEGQTYAAIIGRGMVRSAAEQVTKKGITREVLTFFKEARDSTEGKPVQKVIIDAPTDADPVERVKRILATAAKRLAGEAGTD